MTTKTLITWLPLAIGGSVIMLVAYVTLQQNYRQSANDPQIMLAEDAARALSAGYPLNALFDGSARIDMSKSLATFAMVFDGTGRLLGSSASNGSSSPVLPPSGIFDYVRANGQDRVSWQTPSGLRYAAVVMPWKAGTSTSGFVLVARSLRETEVREDQLGWMFLLGWCGFLFLTFVLKIGASYANRKA